MRVLAVDPGCGFSVSDVHNGWVAGLTEMGCDVKSFNYMDRLGFYSEAKFERDGVIKPALPQEDAIRLAAKGIEVCCYEWWPDVVLVTSGFFVPPEMYRLLRLRGHKVVLLCTESPYEDDRQIQRAPLVDVVLLNDPTNLERFRELNPNTHYVPHAYDPAVHFPREPKEDLASDFCFVGTGYPSRIKFLESVDWEGIHVALGGNWQGLSEDSPLREFVEHPIEHCLDNSDTHALYSATKASANLYRREATEGGDSKGWACGPREIELAASGTFFLRDPRPESDELFGFLPTFDGPEDFGEKLRFYLKRDDARELLAERAREAVADRTFANNAATLLRLLDA